VENQADAFAAAFPMPARNIRDELPSYADWPTLFDLKRRWQVALAALLLRAKNLGCMTDASYLTAVKALSARGRRRREPIPIGHPENPPACGRSPESTAATASARQSHATSSMRSPEPICRDRTARPLAGTRPARRHQGSARIQHAVRKRREPTGNNGQSAGTVRPAPAGPLTDPRGRGAAQEIPADQRKRRPPGYFSSCRGITNR
jgi:hypothetical protein